MRERAAGLVAPAGFAVAVVVLVVAGGGRLAAPEVGHLGTWAEDVGPILAAVALVRLAALGAAGWLLLVTGLSGLARLVGAVVLARRIDGILPAPVRRALAGVAGAGMVGAVAVGVAGAGGSGAVASAAVERLVRLADDPSDPPVVETMHLLPDDGPAPVAAPVPDPAAVPADGWTVAPGDSFWSIAEDVLGDRLGRPPTDAEIAPFWRAVVDANRDRLVSGDADLIYPGQVFVLPG